MGAPLVEVKEVHSCVVNTWAVRRVLSTTSIVWTLQILHFFVQESLDHFCSDVARLGLYLWTLLCQ